LRARRPSPRGAGRALSGAGAVACAHCTRRLRPPGRAAHPLPQRPVLLQNADARLRPRADFRHGKHVGPG
jgi:hypothetical protein